MEAAAAWDVVLAHDSAIRRWTGAVWNRRHARDRLPVSFEDAVAVAQIAAFESASRWLTGCGSFEAFAYRRVCGELVDHLWPKRKRARRDLYVEPLSFEELNFEDNLGVDETLGDPHDEIAEVEERIDTERLLAALLDRLSPRERLLAAALMSEDPPSLAAIGRTWGVTESRISQIRCRVKRKLAELLEEVA